MNSLREVAVVLFVPSSWSFLVCSFSMRADMDFMSVVKDWNWVRFRRGPRLKDHIMGRMSRARKSESTVGLIALKTSRAAICCHVSMKSMWC